MVPLVVSVRQPSLPPPARTALGAVSETRCGRGRVSSKRGQRTALESQLPNCQLSPTRSPSPSKQIGKFAKRGLTAKSHQNKKSVRERTKSVVVSVSLLGPFLLVLLLQYRTDNRHPSITAAATARCRPESSHSFFFFGICFLLHSYEDHVIPYADAYVAPFHLQSSRVIHAMQCLHYSVD
jgi:hypothetical protein